MHLPPFRLPSKSCLAWAACSLLLAASGCADSASEVPPAPEAGGSPSVRVEGPPRQEAAAGGNSMAASPLGSPRDVVAHQYVLLRAGQTEELKQLFVASVREEITPELVDQLRENMKPVSLKELVSEVVPEEGAERETFVIKRSDGSTLTRIIRQDGNWQADTVWFK